MEPLKIHVFFVIGWIGCHLVRNSTKPGHVVIGFLFSLIPMMWDLPKKCEYPDKAKFNTRMCENKNLINYNTNI